MKKDIPVIGAIHDLEGADAFVDQDEYRLGVMTGELAGKWISENLDPDAEFCMCLVLTVLSMLLSGATG